MDISSFIFVMWLLLFIWMDIVNGICPVADDNKSENEHMVGCIVKISATYFIDGRTIVISRTGVENIIATKTLHCLHQQKRWPIGVYETSMAPMGRDPLLLDLRNDDRHYGYVIFVSSLETMKLQLLQLQSLSAWNSRGKFVIVFDKSSIDFDKDSTVKNVLEHLWLLWKIYNVVALKSCTNSSDGFCIDIITWYPYKLPSGQCGELFEIIKIGTCITTDSRVTISEQKCIFEEKIPWNFGECSWRASTVKFVPFIVYRNDSIVGGSDVKMMNSLAKSLNMTLKITVPPGRERKGKRFPNGTWTGTRGDLFYGRADVIFGHMILNWFDHLIFDDTVLYFSDEVKWFVARAKPYPRWLSMLRVFTPSSWFAILISIPLAAVVLTGLTKRKTVHFGIVFRRFMTVYAIFLGEGTTYLANSTSLRIFILFWLIYCMAIDTIFETFVTSYLVDPGLLHQVSSVEELKHYNAVFAFSEVLDGCFTKDYLSYLVPRLKCDPEECLAYLVSHENVATYLSDPIKDYSAENFMKEGFNGFYSLIEGKSYTPAILVLQRDSPLLERINDALTRFFEAGLPDKYYRDSVVVRRLEIGVGELKPLLEDYVPFSTSHLQGALLMYSLGIVLSVFVFILEIGIMILQFNIIDKWHIRLHN